MQWMKLELRKASNIRKEVDDAIKALNDAVESSDAGAIDVLRRSFELRIQELEEFYLHNDDDDRAVLFEKQRLRLRRALQSAGTTATPAKKTPARAGTRSPASPTADSASPKAKQAPQNDIASSPAIQEDLPPQRQKGPEKSGHSKQTREIQPEPVQSSYSADAFNSPDNDGRMDEMNDQDVYASPPTAANDLSAIPNTIDTQQPSDTQSQANASMDGANANNRVPDTPTSDMASSTRLAGDKSSARSSSKKKSMPLYMWEVKEDKRDQVVLASMRPRRQTEHGTFIATSVLGYYQKSPYLNAPDTHVDLQMVLNEDEFASLANRCRTSKAELRHQTRFTGAGGDELNTSSLQSSAPYIEPGRVLDTLYRPNQKDKWVNEKDFDLAIGKK